MSYAVWSVVFGEQPSAAKWNILGTNDASFNNGTGIASLEIGSGHTILTLDQKFSVYRNTSQTLGTAATKVQWNTENFDTGSNFDSTTNFRFTAPVAGFYFFTAHVDVPNTASIVTASLFLYKNGSAVRNLQLIVASTSAFTAVGGTELLQLAANDFVEVYAQSTGASFSLTGTNANNYFSGFLLSQL